MTLSSLQASTTRATKPSWQVKTSWSGVWSNSTPTTKRSSPVLATARLVWLLLSGWPRCRRQPVTVALLNKSGTSVMVASAAITLGAKVYPAADGKISSSSTGRAVGIALLAAVTAGDEIEVLLLESLAAADLVNSFTLFDDFFHFTSTENFTSVLTDSGTASVSDERAVARPRSQRRHRGGQRRSYVKSTAEIFLFANGKPLLRCEGWLDRSEHRRRQRHRGLHERDRGQQPPKTTELDRLRASAARSSSKVDGGTTWRAMVSLGSTQTEVTSATFRQLPAQATLRSLRSPVVPTSSTSATACFYIDSILVGSQAFTYTGATEMNAGAGVKNGGANNESLEIDYILASQVR